jgi:hypothetical protein
VSNEGETCETCAFSCYPAQEAAQSPLEARDGGGLVALDAAVLHIERDRFGEGERPVSGHRSTPSLAARSRRAALLANGAGRGRRGRAGRICAPLG